MILFKLRKESVELVINKSDTVLGNIVW